MNDFLVYIVYSHFQKFKLIFRVTNLLMTFYSIILTQMNTNTTHTQFDIVDQVLIHSEIEQTPNVIDYLFSLPKKGRYLRWNGYLLSLLLEFHLQQMVQHPEKIPSFREKSRRHTGFDRQFTTFTLKRLGINNLTNVQKIGPILKDSSKAKFASMKRSYLLSGGDDYIELIPKMARNQFEAHGNVDLLIQIKEWQRIKERATSSLKPIIQQRRCKTLQKKRKEMLRKQRGKTKLLKKQY